MSEIDFFHVTDAGCVRDGNEDAIGCWPYEDGIVFAVADGLGGHNAGEVASALALEVLAEEIDSAPRTWPLDKRLKRAVQEANLRIYSKATTVPELRKMGTTLTASAVVGSTLVTAHVGDCRLYLLRSGNLTQLTKDHSWVWDQVQYGILTPEEARTHPRRNILSRCLGHELIVGIDVLKLNVHPGDVLLQCSDGIHTLIAESEMTEFLQASSPDNACQAMIQRARDVGGHDNLSVQVASVIACSPDAPRPWWRFGR
jgi:serine/threonine protein phosphatase PrpC